MNKNFCVLSEDKKCDRCQACMLCDLNSAKICDNCCSCLEPNNKKDYETILVDFEDIL